MRLKNPFLRLPVGILAILFAMIALMASADTLPTIDFESYTVGTVHNQDGWSSSGAAGSGCALYDHKVVSNAGQPYNYPTFGTKSLRLSNAVVSGCFSDQTFSKSVPVAAGETSAQGGAFSSAPGERRFVGQWDFASAVPNAEQPNLSVVVSMDRGDGARMNWIQMADTPSGLAVNFYGYSRALDPGCITGAGFVFSSLVSGLSRSSVHTIKVEMILNDGVDNDQVNVWVDGIQRLTNGKSWEDYFRDCEGNLTRTVDSLLFRTGGSCPDNCAPGSLGKGFLIDNIKLSSGYQVPVVNTNSSTINFYAYSVGQCSGYQSINIRNDDRNTPLTGATATITGTNAGDFQFQNGTQIQAIPSVGPMVTYAILVNFCRIAPGQRFGTLTISGGNMAAPIVVNLVGN